MKVNVLKGERHYKSIGNHEFTHLSGHGVRGCSTVPSPPQREEG